MENDKNSAPDTTHDPFSAIYIRRELERKTAHDNIVSIFDGLSLEEKIDKLIDLYAWDRAYR